LRARKLRARAMTQATTVLIGRWGLREVITSSIFRSLKTNFDVKVGHVTPELGGMVADKAWRQKPSNKPQRADGPRGRISERAPKQTEPHLCVKVPTIADILRRRRRLPKPSSSLTIQSPCEGSVSSSSERQCVSSAPPAPGLATLRTPPASAVPSAPSLGTAGSAPQVICPVRLESITRHVAWRRGIA
jgi:hypothetical protein